MKYILAFLFFSCFQNCFAQNAQEYSKLLGVLYNIDHSAANPELKNQKEYEEIRSFIKANPTNGDVFRLISEAKNFHVWQLDNLMSLTDTSLLRSPLRPFAENTLRRIRVAETGKPFPEFIFKDTLNQPLAVSSLKGKFVLIDVWSSICRPCRMEMPALKKIYETHKDKGFEIIGVSLDADKKQWLTAVRSDGLTWPQYCELQIWQNNMFAKKFFINAIPSNFLLDRNGVILGQDLSPEQVEGILKQMTVDR